MVISWGVSEGRDGGLECKDERARRKSAGGTVEECGEEGGGFVVAALLTENDSM